MKKLIIQLILFFTFVTMFTHALQSFKDTQAILATIEYDATVVSSLLGTFCYFYVFGFFNDNDRQFILLQDSLSVLYHFLFVQLLPVLSTPNIEKYILNPEHFFIQAIHQHGHNIEIMRNILLIQSVYEAADYNNKGISNAIYYHKHQTACLLLNLPHVRRRVEDNPNFLLLNGQLPIPYLHENIREHIKPGNFPTYLSLDYFKHQILPSLRLSQHFIQKVLRPLKPIITNFKHAIIFAKIASLKEQLPMIPKELWQTHIWPSYKGLICKTPVEKWALPYLSLYEKQVSHLPTASVDNSVDNSSFTQLQNR